MPAADGTSLRVRQDTITMRLAIDARTLTAPKTGDRTVALGFIKGLMELETDLEVALVSQEPIPFDLIPDAPNLTRHVIPAPSGYLWMPLAFPRALRDLKADVGLIQYMGPFSAPCPLVTTIHDTVWRTMPETFPWKDRMVLDAFLPGTIRRAAAVTTGSEFARSEILRYYPQAAAKTQVVPYGVDAAFRPVDDEAACAALRRKYDLPERFILSVGVLQPRKNVEGLIRAYAQLPSELRHEYALVITGKRGWLTDNLPRVAAGEGVLFTGYVEDAELPALYSLATCFAYPSLYEGFGLPPLEAMACGTPVVTSTVASLPEVTGEAALLVDPTDTPALSAALARLLTNDALCAELRAKGLLRAAQFTWAKSAAQLLGVLRQAAGRPG